MKRRQSLPLLRALEPDEYLVDTSSWLRIDLRPDSEDAWALVLAHIEQGHVFACSEVLDELRDDPIYLLRLKKCEKALRAGDRGSDDIDYLLYVGRVTRDHPAMSKATGTKTPADPYIVALAELESYVVVADETCEKRANRKIPGVCCQRGIRCITLDQFLTELRKGMALKSA